MPEDSSDLMKAIKEQLTKQGKSEVLSQLKGVDPRVIPFLPDTYLDQAPEQQWGSRLEAQTNALWNRLEKKTETPSVQPPTMPWSKEEAQPMSSLDQVTQDIQTRAKDRMEKLGSILNNVIPKLGKGAEADLMAKKIAKGVDPETGTVVLDRDTITKLPANVIEQLTKADVLHPTSAKIGEVIKLLTTAGSQGGVRNVSESGTGAAIPKRERTPQQELTRDKYNEALKKALGLAVPPTVNGTPIETIMQPVNIELAKKAAADKALTDFMAAQIGAGQSATVPDWFSKLYPKADAGVGTTALSQLAPKQPVSDPVVRTGTDPKTGKRVGQTMSGKIVEL